MRIPPLYFQNYLLVRLLIQRLVCIAIKRMQMFCRIAAERAGDFAPEKTDYTKTKINYDEICLFTTQIHIHDRKRRISVFLGASFLCKSVVFYSI